jgi:hypothetical protein
MARYAILRVAKLKGSSKINSASNHNTRSMEVPNADPSKPHYELIKSDKERTLYSQIKERIDSVGARSRSNSVLALEYMMSFSPEMVGKIDKKQWAKDATKWLIEKHGRENVLQVDLHLDETTPHLHALVVPLTRDNRLSAKQIIGGPKGLREMQSSFAAAMKPHGLVRGVGGSRGTHKRVKAFYGDMRLSLARAVKRASAAAKPKKGVLGGVDWKTAYKAAMAALRESQALLQSQLRDLETLTERRAFLEKRVGKLERELAPIIEAGSKIPRAPDDLDLPGGSDRQLALAAATGLVESEATRHQEAERKRSQEAAEARQGRETETPGQRPGIDRKPRKRRRREPGRDSGPGLGM